MFGRQFKTVAMRKLKISEKYSASPYIIITNHNKLIYIDYCKLNKSGIKKKSVVRMTFLDE